MTQIQHTRLFHPRLVREAMTRVSDDILDLHRECISVWIDHLGSGVLDETKETSLHGGFLERIFGDVLGYSTMATAQGGKWELVAEKSLHEGSSADGAIGRFERGVQKVLAPIELKGATQSLEHAKGRQLTPIQQGWDYANKAPESLFIIVSNYRETRLYAKSAGSAAYERFLLEELADDEGMRRFIALLGRDALLSGPSWDHSPIAEMLVASERQEHEITARLYADYRDLRSRLFDELLRAHVDAPAESLLGHAQTILDRVLFIAFAEDRQLVPGGTLARAYEHRDPYNPRSIWQNFAAVFRSVDVGNSDLGIPAYNGGLFAEDPVLEELAVSDEMCADLKRLGDYDFSDDVSVDVLGRIFEQSITDLEQLRDEARSAPTRGLRIAETKARSKGTQKDPGKRKTQGVFYTPAFVTSFLVRETLGRVLASAWERAGAGLRANRLAKVERWQRYQDELRSIRVLDPSCGSGAFLIAAFDALGHEFERANRALATLGGDAGQRGLFDLTKTLLNENLFGVDKSGESVEIAKLSLWLKTAEHGKRLTFLDRNIRMANSVVADPAVDPFAFDWELGRVAKSLFDEPSEVRADDATISAIDARWRDGFDVVLGNPPYVRQELLKPYKAHWKKAFRAYAGTADLFVYFIERGLDVLKPGGFLGYIVSNKWMRGGYAERLRELLKQDVTIERLVDFGHAPVFPDADAFPCLLIVRKEPPVDGHDIRVTRYPREELGKERLASFVEQHEFPLPQLALADDGWSLDTPKERQLMEALRERGTRLRDFTSVKPYRGVLTGLNTAFLVDDETKRRLCREDPRSEEILKPYLRGQDVDRWAPEWADLWMIFTRRGTDIDAYPAIRAHLEPFRTQLKPRPRNFTGSKWPGRKAGSYSWFEIQDTVDYWELFEQPKILYQEIQFHPRFALDESGLYTNNKAFLLPSGDPWLLAVLNSPAMWWHNWRHLVHLKDEALSPAGDRMVHVPIPEPTDEQRERVSELVEQVLESTREMRKMTRAVLDVLRVEYQVEKPGARLPVFDALAVDDFMKELKQRRPKAARFSPRDLEALRELHAAKAEPLRQRRSTIVQIERELASHVHAAFGMGEADLELMRATSPPRMPPGW